MNSKFKIASKSLSIILILYLLKEFIFLILITIGSVSPGGYPPGVYNVKKFNDRQTRYFWLERKFVTAEDLFSDGLELDLTNYKYSVENLNNVVGAVFIVVSDRKEDLKSKNILCISETPGWQQLNKPYLQDGEAVCGEGTRKY